MNGKSSQLIYGLVICSVLLPLSAWCIGPPHDSSNGIWCNSCHIPHGRDRFARFVPVPYGADQEEMCKQCHNPTGQAGSMSDVANHVVNGGATVIDCGSCHDSHGAQTSFDQHSGVAADNLSLVRTDTGRYVSEALEPAIFQIVPDNFAFASDNPPYNGICQSCHTQTNHHQNDGTAPGGQSHFDGADCTLCHTHASGFAPVAGPHPQAQTAICAECHVDPDTGEQDIRDVHNNQCQLCHTDGTFGTVLGPSGSWNRECTACHDHASISVQHDCLDCHGVHDLR